MLLQTMNEEKNNFGPKNKAWEQQKRARGAHPPNQKKREKNPVILVWTSSAPLEQKGIEFVAKEEYGSCRVTMDRSALKKSIAVVLFNYHKKLDPPDMPDSKTR